jgi:myo-inositol-1(or 4)-monophosphatase
MAQSALMNIMVQAATKAGKSLTRDFGEVANLQVSIKGPSDYVSEADKKAEKVIAETLKNARPDYAFLMEESGYKKGADKQHCWIVDPLDGTTNFLHSIPLFAISIALQSQGTLMAGVIYNPITEELFTTERGQGAFLNNRRLRVGGRRNLSDCVVSGGIPHLGRPNHGQYLLEQRNMMSEVAGVRRLGSAALDLAWVAAGRFDGFWERGLNSWDVAAGMLLVKEAGGFVSEIDGGEDPLNGKSIVAANDPIIAKMRRVLNKK